MDTKNSYVFHLKNNKTIVVISVAAAILILFPLFGNLDAKVLRFWDESRLAINAYEMNKNGNWFVTYFDGKPDMWNTKPPLMIWLQTLFIKILGPNETALRFPSAIAAFLTCLALMWFSVKHTENYWFGLLSVLVLITSSGFIHEHAARTGDYDALVTLFTTLYCFFFFFFTETNDNKYLYYFFICLSFAVLTKSSAGLLFIPGLLIYLFIQKKFIRTLKNKHLYSGIALFIVSVSSIYLLRESMNPGYIKAVAGNELHGRLLNVIEGHQEGFFYYYSNLVSTRFSLWWLFIPLGVFFGLFNIDDKIFRQTLFFSLITFIFLFIISAAGTKLFWYDVPVYPFLAIIVASFLFFIFTLLQKIKFGKKEIRSEAAAFLLLGFLFITPYQRIVEKVCDNKEKFIPGDYELSYFLKEAVRGKYDLNGHYLSWQGTNTPDRFYLYVLQDKNVKIAFKDWRNLNPDDKVIVYQEPLKEYITSSYNSAIVKEYNNITIYNIYGKKQIN